MSDEQQISDILQSWAANTRRNNKDAILANHADDVVIFDVLPPMKYHGVEAYRKSWDDWQPDTVGEGVFELQNLELTVGGDVAFAHAFIHCGGTTANGKTFEDLVRATFCLRKITGKWVVTHQHISMPMQK